MRTEREIRTELFFLRARPELQTAPATTTVNAPLALVQMGIEARIDALNWVLQSPAQLAQGGG